MGVELLIEYSVVPLVPSVEAIIVNEFEFR
jgi:hypothetical protein